MRKTQKIRKPKVPTARESLAGINDSFSRIADALLDSKGVRDVELAVAAFVLAKPTEIHEGAPTGLKG